MSYILEALRRADAERERGRAPDLHAQPRPRADEVGPARVRPLAWLAGGLVVGVVVAAWFVGSGRDEGAAPAPPAITGGPGPGVAATAPALPAATTAAPDAPTPPVAPVEPPGESRPTSPPLALPPLPRPVVPDTTPDHVAAAQREAPGADAPPALHELPESIRRELPPLRVGGSVHSEQPAARLLILDGRVLREGEWLQPDLVVERIGVRDAVLRYRDRAFTLAY